MPRRLLNRDLLDRLLTRLSKPANDAAARAKVHCQKQGTKLDGMPLLVLAVLLHEGRGMGAYDLIDTLAQRVGHVVRPPTVYRALEQLQDLKLVARLASRNAFVACAHPGHRHDCVLLVCDRCGHTVELEDRRLDKLILQDLRRTGFEPRHRTLEIEGTCRGCRTP
jgi:Fur family zinc uptake transcriptional regulator